MTRSETVRFTEVAHEDEPIGRVDVKAQKQWDDYFEREAAAHGRLGRGSSLHYVSGVPQSPGSRYMVYTFEGTIFHQDE